MKEMIKNSCVCGYLEKIYRQLNTDMFGGELEEVLITVQSSSRSYGYVTCNKVWKVKGICKYELNISAEYLDRPIEDIVSTILHEMVHVYNQMHGIQDCSRGMTYHNKRFREKAESVGLMVEHDSRIGWSITKPSEKLIDYIVAQQWTDILISRVRTTAISAPTDKGNGDKGVSDNAQDKKPSSTRKYICPRCGMSVRATKTVRIKCADCDMMMTTA